MKQLFITLVLLFTLLSIQAQTSVWVSGENGIESVEVRVETYTGHTFVNGTKKACKVEYYIDKNDNRLLTIYYLTQGYIMRNNKVHKIVKTDTMTPYWFWKAVFTEQKIAQ